MMAFIPLAVLAVAGVYIVTIYNGLVRLKHNVTKAWANIDVILKQRHEELPKLVEVCRQYMTHEKETLERVMKARSAVAGAQETMNLGALGAAEGELRGVLGRLFAVAESYPDLKANQTFANLAARISQLEGAIADRRELYNDTVNQNNTRLEQVPDSFIASLGSFKPAELLSFSREETADVDVKNLFKS